MREIQFRGMDERCYPEKMGPIMEKPLKDGVPCSHPGCLSHMSHPCEGCGRIGGINKKGELQNDQDVKGSQKE